MVNKFSPGRDNGSQGRDLGVMVTGNVDGGNRSSVEYSAAFLNGGGIYNVATARDKAFATRVVFHPVTGLSIGGDFYKGMEQSAGAPASGSLSIGKQRQDIEAGYRAGALVLWGEYLWGRDGAIERSGGYALAGYRFAKHWETFARVQSFDSLHLHRGNMTRLYEAGANYYVTQLVRLQANYGIEKTAATGSLAQVVLTQIQAEF